MKHEIQSTRFHDGSTQVWSVAYDREIDTYTVYLNDQIMSSLKRGEARSHTSTLTSLLTLTLPRRVLDDIAEAQTPHDIDLYCAFLAGRLTA